MEHTIGFKANETGEFGIITIQGPLGVAHVRDARKALLGALKDVANLTVDLDGLTDADLTTLQLFCSAHKYCLPRQKKISIKGGCPEIFSRIMDENGYRVGVGCPPGAEESCLWKADMEQEGRHE